MFLPRACLLSSPFSCLIAPTWLLDLCHFLSHSDPGSSKHCPRKRGTLRVLKAKDHGKGKIFKRKWLSWHRTGIQPQLKPATTYRPNWLPSTRRAWLRLKMGHFSWHDFSRQPIQQLPLCSRTNSQTSGSPRLSISLDASNQPNATSKLTHLAKHATESSTLQDVFS